LDFFKICWIRRVAPTNREAMGPLREKEDQGVVPEIIITPKGIPTIEHAKTQFHPLSRRIGGLVWMN
jgi:hypothetical protein